MSDYNGWTNRATWNVNLWIENDYGFYKAKQAMQGDTPNYWTAPKVENWVQSVMPNKTPDGIPYDDVNWTEIAESWNAE